MKPGDRLYNIWMPIAMICIVVITILSIASFVIDHAPEQCSVVTAQGVVPGPCVYDDDSPELDR